MEKLLSVRQLTVRYGAVTAVDGFNLDLAPGQIVGLIGPNGAGKTSLIDALTGFTRASGSITLSGTEIGQLPAHKRAHLGMSRAWQSLELFDDLTVLENLQVAQSAGHQRGARKSVPSAAALDAVLAQVGLEVAGSLLPTQLSQGQRKLLALARALAASPSVLLADEPAAGLDTIESQALGQRLRAIADTGVGILLIDHDMGLVLNLCDYIYAMDFGRPLAHGTPAQIRQDPNLISAYLGASRERPIDDAAEVS